MSLDAPLERIIRAKSPPRDVHVVKDTERRGQPFKGNDIRTIHEECQDAPMSRPS